MFGYVIINKSEMKFKDFDMYRSYYCGLCRTLKHNYGIKGQLTLNYDLTFLAVLLTGLYEPNTTSGSCRCIAHPFEKHTTLTNIYTEYAADMNILLSYYKCVDDWKDEKRLEKKLMSQALKHSFEKISAKYPEKSEIIWKLLEELNQYEKEESTDIDTVSGCFGKIMEELFCFKKDEWEKRLRHMGFYLGKYIFILDAYNDAEEDIKRNRYNPLKKVYKDKEYCKNILIMMMAECSKEFEILPIIQNIDILRNIIYAGVWSRFT